MSLCTCIFRKDERPREKNRMGRGQTLTQTDTRTSRLYERIGQGAESLKILSFNAPCNQSTTLLQQ